MIFLGLYLAKVMGKKVLPNEPVPPVIKMVELLSMRSSLVRSEPFGLPIVKKAAVVQSVKAIDVPRIFYLMS
jgi:hypothetical protein